LGWEAFGQVNRVATSNSLNFKLETFFGLPPSKREELEEFGVCSLKLGFALVGLGSLWPNEPVSLRQLG
jgi:hypothetical protein